MRNMKVNLSEVYVWANGKRAKFRVHNRIAKLKSILNRNNV